MATRDEVTKNIGKVIKKALENKKISQTEIAKKLVVTKPLYHIMLVAREYQKWTCLSLFVKN